MKAERLGWSVKTQEEQSHRENIIHCILTAISQKTAQNADGFEKKKKEVQPTDDIKMAAQMQREMYLNNDFIIC